MKAIILLGVFALIAAAKEVEVSKRPRDCAGYESPGTIAQCAGMQYNQKVITAETFAALLDKAREKLPVATKAHVIGFTTGVDKEIMVSTIKDPRYESKIGVSYDPREWSQKASYMSTELSGEKPILLFSKTEVQVPEWKPEAMIMQRMGTSTHKTVYKVKDAHAIKEAPTENCGALQKWISEVYLKDWKNVVIVMPARLWCTQVKGGTADLIVGEAYEVSNRKGSSLYGVENEVRVEGPGEFF
uniref:Putative capsid protein n=1 Tax=Soybean thrips virus 1 TaxID=2796560 RepID=A0A7T3R0M6_9VIRU|nr:putative capsid protein [Soybean thrips virus 1]